MHQILTKIYPEDIYRDFVPMPESITGWGGDAPIFKALIQKVKPKVIIEVGSWKGQSTITMAEACKAYQIDSVIICVDTWLGSEEHILQCRRELAPANGFPTLYYQFLSNVVRRGVQEWIVPLPTTSLIAANVLACLDIKADLIYIDASHQYEAVMADLKAFTPLLAKGGTLFGHDYCWESVRNAVVNFCKNIGAKHTKIDDFWILNNFPPDETPELPKDARHG